VLLFTICGAIFATPLRASIDALDQSSDMLAPLEDGVMALAMAEAAKRFFDEGVTVNLANI
tara:strand:+ start:1116 stop:1298 length:183 start_codon:yes stop_codon:yes gene_type:complete